jgi:hypothetical protein
VPVGWYDPADASLEDESYNGLTLSPMLSRSGSK